MSVDTGFICAALVRALPPSCSNQVWAKRPRIGDGFRRPSQPTRGCASTIARAEAGAIRYPLPQDGVAVATDLHILLDRAHVPGPFVLVGHSSGAQYVRIFAGRYPEQVAGMVLLDGQPAEAFEGLPSYPVFYRVFHRIFAVLPTLARLGVGRVVVQPDARLARAGSRHAARSLRVSRFYRSLRDEFEELPTSLAQARSFQSLGDRPLVVVTAAQDAQAGWLPLQDRMATLSTNSSHRVVPYAHVALVTDQTAAQTSIHAIRDVVHAVRSHVPLDKS